MNRKTAVIFYILGAYVLLQFSWWAYHLIDLTTNKGFATDESSRKVMMILSEGLVFFLILIVGLWYIRRSIKKDLLFSNRQKNFLLSVTHELKTPIAANQLLLQTLRKRDVSIEMQHDLLDRTLEENSRLEALVNNILNATKIDNQAISLHKEKRNIGDFVKQVTQTFATTQHLKNITIDIQANTELLIDISTLSIVLINLLENARKYAGKEEEIKVSIEENDLEVFILVRDLGPGIPKNMHGEVFKMFERVGNEETRLQKGTGLGLFIAQQFAQLNNGKLTCQEIQGKGTLMKLSIRK